MSTEGSSESVKYVGFFANIIPGIWNKISCHLTQKEFVPFQEAFVSNTTCRSRWREIARTMQKLVNFEYFDNKNNFAALKWVLRRNINALDWSLQCAPPRSGLPLGAAEVELFEDDVAQLMAIFCKRGDSEIVKALVELRGADVNMILPQCVFADALEEQEGNNVYEQSPPLVIAATRGWLTLAKYLIEKSANVNQGDLIDLSLTPVLCAARRGDVPMIKLLHAHGALLNPQPACITTPLHEAVWHGQNLLIDYLCGQGTNVDLEATAPPRRAGWESNIDPKTSESKMYTALHYALVQDRFSTEHTEAVVESLLRAGANINAVTGTDMTALHFAARDGKLSVLRLLIEKGADQSIRNTEGLTPFELAVSEVERLANRDSASEEYYDGDDWDGIQDGGGHEYEYGYGRGSGDY